LQHVSDLVSKRYRFIIVVSFSKSIKQTIVFRIFITEKSKPTAVTVVMFERNMGTVEFKLNVRAVGFVLEVTTLTNSWDSGFVDVVL